MAFGNATFTDAGGAVSDLFSSEATATGLRLKAQGDVVEGQNYSEAAQLALDNEKFTETSTAIKEAQQQRSTYQMVGGQRADVSGAGFAESGSALDLMRDSASQGALTKAVLSQQGAITEEGQQEQATAYENLAGYANMAAGVEDNEASKAQTAGEVSAGIKGAAAIATLFA